MRYRAETFVQKEECRQTGLAGDTENFQAPPLDCDVSNFADCFRF